ncbi:MAG: hypothetical protein NTW14_06180 [bacterium]|nr:hypothetical protein [bacterium]
MKKTVVLILLVFLMIGCQEKGTDLQSGQEWAHLTGQAKYSDNLQPINGAFVRTQTHLETTQTDSTGHYDLAIALPKDVQESVTLEIFKEGYLAVNLPAVIKAGQTTPMPVATLERYLDSTIIDTLGTGSGPAVGMVLIYLNPDTLSVNGAGGPTMSHIICQVLDASGKPVDSLHATQISFSLTLNPGGGAYIYPTSDVTDDSGYVATNFFSGTDAGSAIIRVQFTGASNFIVLPEILIYQTGAPAAITLQSIEYDSIAVRGVGANEVTTAVFVVRDAGGSPLTLQQPTAINFAILGSTGGGEYIFPTSDVTDGQGQVSTTLNSGTVAGTVQLLAYLAADSSVVCTPVSVAIHSGLPDATHFAVYPRWLNFPGFNYYGVVDSISALVADRYANPVPLGTSVYFTTNAGVIEGSSVTDTTGFANVRLFSGAPSPPSSYPFGTITAQTVGEGGQIITDQALVLFSGITQITEMTPTTFTIPNEGLQVFAFTVSDQNGYPLTHDTHIVVTATAGGILGDIDVTFPDTQSQSWTHFGFILFDTNIDETDPPVQAAVSINITSVNGDASMILQGTID